MKFDRAKMLEQHAKATVNLYGAISLAEWDDIFHQHYGEHLEPADLELLRRLKSYDFYFWNDYLVQHVFRMHDFTEVPAFLEAVSETPRYIPDKDEYLKHATPGYFEWTPQIAALDKYVRGKMALTGESAKGMVNLIATACMSGESTKELILHISTFTEDEYIIDLYELVSDVRNHSRTWYNKGFTPAELFAMYVP